MESEPISEPRPFASMEGILLIVGFVVVSVTFAGFVVLVSHFDMKIALPMLSIAGIVLLLISLTAVSYVFSRVGLQNKSEALGLPSGSIQSVIALSLIVLFAILSVFLFMSIGGASSVREIHDLSVEERNDQTARLGQSFAGWEQQKEPGKYTIFVRDPGVEARNDVGKQLIVLIGTLMTSAVSFYFGSRATASGAAVANAGAARAVAAASPAPVIETIEPTTELPKGQTSTIKIVGGGLKTATTVAVRQGIAELVVGDLKVYDNEISLTISPPVTASSGAYDLVVLADTRPLVARKAAITLAP